MIKFKYFSIDLPVYGNYQGDHTATIDAVGYEVTDLIGNKEVHAEIKAIWFKGVDVYPLIDSRLINLYELDSNDNILNEFYTYYTMAMAGADCAAITYHDDSLMTIEKIDHKEVYYPSLQVDDLNKVEVVWDIYKVSIPVKEGSVSIPTYTADLFSIHVDSQRLFDGEGEEVTTDPALLNVREAINDRFADKHATTTCKHDFEEEHRVKDRLRGIIPTEAAAAIAA